MIYSMIPIKYLQMVDPLGSMIDVFLNPRLRLEEVGTKSERSEPLDFQCVIGLIEGKFYRKA